MNNLGVNQYTGPRRTAKGVIFSWLGVIVSLLLLVPTGAMIRDTVASFRPCSINDSGLALSACGKHNIAPMDLLMIAIFIAVDLLVISAITHAIRVTRRRP